MADALITKFDEFVAGGKPLVIKYHDNGDGTFSEIETTLSEINSSASFQYTSPTAITNTTPVTLAAASAGVKNRLTGYTVINTNATATQVQILSGSTVVWNDYIPANGRISHSVSTGSSISTTANNTALNFQAVTTGASLFVNATGYQSA